MSTIFPGGLGQEALGHPAADPAVTAAESGWLSRLETLTTAELHRPELTVSELAELLAISVRTFYRATKRLLGLTPAQYLTATRFQCAYRLLEGGRALSVKEAARRVGFRHAPHFAKGFRQRFGRAVTDYQLPTLHGHVVAPRY